MSDHLNNSSVQRLDDYSTWWTFSFIVYTLYNGLYNNQGQERIAHSLLSRPVLINSLQSSPPTLPPFSPDIIPAPSTTRSSMLKVWRTGTSGTNNLSTNRWQQKWRMSIPRDYEDKMGKGDYFALPLWYFEVFRSFWVTAFRKEIVWIPISSKIT